MTSPATPRLQLWVAGSPSGTTKGACPFSATVILFVKVKGLPEAEYELCPVLLDNKSEEFLTVNPGGTVPYLVDQVTGTGTDGTLIILRYIEELYPTPDMRLNYNGPALEATDLARPKFFKLLKVDTVEEIAQQKTELTKEMRRINMYLGSSARKGKKYLIDDELRAVDCTLINTLHHILVAATWFRGYTIPSEYSSLWDYIKLVEEHNVWKAVKPADEDIVSIWASKGLTRILNAEETK